MFTIVFILFIIYNISNSYTLKQFKITKQAKSLLRNNELARDVSSLWDTSSGGKIVITGLGQVDEDEFFLNLLNEQSVWDPIVLATDDSNQTQKRFLSRTARYSGLLNILTFTDLLIHNDTQLKDTLNDAKAWIAFNVSQELIPKLSDIAIESNLKRVIFTIELPKERIRETNISEFDYAIDLFQSNGVSFTGIRHGVIISGDENNAYEIVNATVPCLEDTVERGVLARVTAELLQIEKSFNSHCGLSSSSSFAGAYLNVLRSSGLTRRQEVEKVFSGGIQRVARLTVNKYEEEKQMTVTKKKDQEKKIQTEVESELKKEAERNRRMNTILGEQKPIDVDDDEFTGTTVREAIVKRTEEILNDVWKEYDTRMYTKSSSKFSFFETNRDKARVLAEKEIEEELKIQEQKLEELKFRTELSEKLVDVNRKQYSKLIALERKEMLEQKQKSDIWIRYIYLLLELTLSNCEDKGILFYNLDQYSQTIVLRNTANQLRQLVNIPEYDVVYDPLDATIIVNKLSNDDIGIKHGIDRPVEELLNSVNSKYSNLLKSLPALRGASQVIELAIETLKKELPPVPPSVNDARRSESLAKQQAVSQLRLDAIRNRGQPSSEGESVVGKL